MSLEQMHMPNPRVNRVKRPEILKRRIKNIRGSLLHRGISTVKRFKLEKKLADYKSEITVLV